MATIDFNKKTYQINLPFAFSTRGAVGIQSDTDPNIYKHKVLTLLSTGINERIWYYKYGAGLTDLLYEPVDTISDTAKTDITEMFGNWLPELSLEQVLTQYDSQLATSTFTIIYKIPSGEIESVKITTESLTAAGEIRSTNNG
jgi:phage baseplate assembly protein W